MRVSISKAGLFECLVALLFTAAAGVFLYHRGLQPPAGAPVPRPAVETQPPAADAPEDITDSGVPEGGIPALTGPAFVPASQAVLELPALGHGLVVVRGNVAKFYPYQILAWHEVANDVIAGEPVAVTYCALCNVGVVYSRRVSGTVATFGVSGKLEGLDSLLYDVDTRTLWSQVTGEALRGPAAGSSLTVVPSTVMSLVEFAGAYPSGLVLSKFTGYVRNYDTLAYGDLATQEHGEKKIAKLGLLHPKTEVFGVTVGARSKAYLADALPTSVSVSDLLGEVRLTLRKDASGNVTATHAGTEIPVQLLKTYWFMWQAWHPDTAIYK